VRKLLLAAVAAAAFGGVGVANATPQPATFTYTLNTILGNPLTPTSFNYGTVTVSDNTTNTNAVDFTISLFGTGSKIQEFDFNTIGALANATFTAVSGTYGTLTVLNDPNQIQADGYTGGKFDVSTPSNGSFGNVVDPLTFTLTAKDTSNHTIDLNASNFDVKDTAGVLYNAVHIGNCAAGTQGCPTGQSIWVGSGPGTTTVPEPMSLALLGSGFAAVGMLKRQRKLA
jgi:hypothetical protein